MLKDEFWWINITIGGFIQWHYQDDASVFHFRIPLLENILLGDKEATKS